MTAQGRVLLHMPQHLADPAKLPGFYRNIASGLTGLGASVAVVQRPPLADRVFAAGADFNIVHNGGARGTGVLNCAIAYLEPYFYADPLGVYFESALTNMVFDPAKVAVQPAQTRFQALQQRYVIPRRSRYAQDPTLQDYPAGAIAVFLQDISGPVERARYMDAVAMVNCVIAEAAGRPVIVKPHPRTRGVETVVLLDDLTRNHPDVIVTEGNLHDILDRAAVCVTISSSVAVESMLHRKPVILFGRSDLHHCAETVRRAADWPAALRRALERDWPYEAFLQWFFSRQLRGGPSMITHLLPRMAAAGADFAALGISPPAPPADQ